MATDLTHEKEQAHELIERLAADQLAAVVNLLQVMTLDHSGVRSIQNSGP